MPSAATHVTFCGLVPGVHYRVDIASSEGDVTQSIMGYTRECQHLRRVRLRGGDLERRRGSAERGEGITGLRHDPLPNCSLFRSPATTVTAGH